MFIEAKGKEEKISTIFSSYARKKYVKKDSGVASAKLTKLTKPAKKPSSIVAGMSIITKRLTGTATTENVPII